MLSAPQRALLWTTVSTALFAVMFALPRAASVDTPVQQIAFLRYVSGFAITLVWYALVRLSGRQVRATTPRRLHMLRACFGIAGVMSGVYAVQHIPLGNAQAIIMSNGAFTLLFAALFLGDRASRRTLAAALVCIVGAVLSARPDLSDHRLWISAGAAAAFLSALAQAGELTILKYTASRDDAVRILLFVNGTAAILLTPLALFAWQPMTMTALLVVGLMGPIAIIGQTCNIRGYRLASASFLTPVRYLAVIFSLLIGIAVFAEIPTPLTLAGAALIVVGGVILSRGR